MIAIFILLFAVAVSVFINRVATQALILTGLSRDIASFQARSITTGTGFTTKEAQSLMNHPTRRRIAMLLMLIQNAGLITVISTFILSFVNTTTSGIALQRALILAGGIGILIFLAKNDWINHQMEKLIDWLLDEYTDLSVIDYHNLLHFGQGYTVSKFMIENNSWLSDKTLNELDLQSEGIMVLSIECEDGSINCMPVGNDTLSAGDRLSVYAKEESLTELRKRLDDASGEQAHEEAKKKHQKS